jgi:hypothetical protein
MSKTSPRLVYVVFINDLALRGYATRAEAEVERASLRGQNPITVCLWVQALPFYDEASHD